MSVGVGPNPPRAGARAEARISRQTPAATSEGLRLPEERAFDVATINRRLASMARKAAPGSSRLRS